MSDPEASRISIVLPPPFTWMLKLIVPSLSPAPHPVFTSAGAQFVRVIDVKYFCPATTVPAAAAAIVVTPSKVVIASASKSSASCTKAGVSSMQNTCHCIAVVLSEPLPGANEKMMWTSAPASA